MNVQQKIEKCLRVAPKPPAPDGLLDKLQADVPAGDVKTRSTAIRRWFAPSGGPISPWRVAAAVALAIMVLLPLSYGAVEVIKRLTTFKATFEYPEDNTTYTVLRTISSKGNIQTEEDARKTEKEFYRLYKEGKAEEIKPGIWRVTFPNGKSFAFGGDPEFLGLSDAEQKEILKKQFDEINELKKAGKFEKTYKPEHDFVDHGVKYRYFEARYTLSDGTVKTVGSAEPVKGEDEDKD